MSELRIRPAVNDDVSAMAALRAQAEKTQAFWQARIRMYMSGAHMPQHALAPREVFVAEIDARVVGLVAGHLTRRFDCQGELEWIDVASAWRRRGIAERLLRRQATWMRDHGAARVCVNVAEDNTIARHLYARYGAVPLEPHWMVWPDVAEVIKK